MKRWICTALLLGCLLHVAEYVQGQQDLLPDITETPDIDAVGAIEVDADSMQYDRQQGRIEAEGNVVIVSGSDRLRADHVLVDVETGDLFATGNVELDRDGEVLRSERMHYNTVTRVSSLDAPELEAEPFRIKAEDLTREDDGGIQLSKAHLTTCERGHDHPHYHVRASSLTVYPGDHIHARHARWYFGQVPVFYVPSWRRRLHDEYGWNLQPGYRSRWGAYLLASYFHRVSPNLRLEHHVDPYSRRGVGLGESMDWQFDGGEGALRLYYIHDRQPQGPTPPASAPDIDRDRYRIFLRHNQQIADDTRLFARAEYVSDINMRRDFFDREYRRLRQPENFVSVTHQRDHYTLSLLANYRLNDFYGNVNRLPEATLDWYRMQLGDTSFYYESESSAAFLERVYPRDDERDSHSSLRVDTLHSVYQPRRLDGWLEVVPRARYRATYYSNSRRTDTTETVTTEVVTNELTLAEETVSETNTVTNVRDGSGQLRQIFEVGSEVSFKAFRRLPDSPGGQPWRHVVEPYLDYSLRFRPTVRPRTLYQYDNIDALDTLHQARIGVRNLLQTKWNDRSVEALDLNLFTTANFDTERGEDTFSTLNMEARLQPATWMRIQSDGVYNLQESEMDILNSRLALSEDDWQFGLEHRYRNGNNNLLMMDATFAPNRDWDMNLFTRYEFEDSRLEEQGGYLQRNFDCMSIRFGGSVLPSYRRTDGTREEADYRVQLAFWLTAFPQMGAR